ncbi:MAG: cadherin-like domain-containing protein [Leptolyngbyaceae cyanobacterium]
MAIPTITNNSLLLVEGQRQTLSLNDLNAESEGAALSDIRITIVPTALAGSFLLTPSGGTATEATEFTLADVQSGRVEFDHDSSNSEPQYSVIATVGEGDAAESSEPQPATITFFVINDAPIFTTNVLSITEGGTVVLNADAPNLVTTDEAGESTPAELTYTILSVSNGTFQQLTDGVATDLGVADTFTQADVDGGLIQFQHDGSETAPSYRLQVVDGGLTDALQPGPKGGGSTTVTIEAFTLVNDPPMVTKSSLAVTEGATVTIGSDDLAATDVESPADELVYTVVIGDAADAAQPDSFIVDGVAQAGPEVTFTQAQVDADLVEFVQGGSNFEPALTVTLSDPETTVDVDFTVDFTAENDAPQFVTNTLSIEEGGTVILNSTETNLQATDELGESTDDALTYTITSVSNGEFQRLTPEPVTLVVGDTFTQAEVDGGFIQFVQDGTSNAPDYALTVSDDGINSDPATAITTDPVSVTIPDGGFTQINDPPLVVNAAFTVTEDKTITLSSENLSTTDQDATAEQLEYTVTIDNTADPDQPDSFEIGGVAQAGPTVTFTQAQVDAGEVVFVQGGSSFDPNLTVTVKDVAIVADGEVNTIDVPLVATLDEVNDPLELQTLSLTLAEGETITLSATILSVTDEESAPEQILYTVDAVTGGSFVTVADDQPATGFSQADIEAGLIAFKSDGLNDAPTFSLTVTDGEASIVVTDESDQGVTFTAENDLPVVVVGDFVVKEGESTLINDTVLSTTDEETALEDLVYTVAIANTDPEQPDGFEIDGVLQTTAEVIFTQAQVNAGLVTFVQGGSSFAPDLTISVKDTEIAGVVNEIPVVLEPDFTDDNDPLRLQTLSFTLVEGDTIPVNTETLSVIDEETLDPAEILYTVDAVTGGDFVTAADDVPTLSFSQADIDAGLIAFKSDGLNDAPTFNLTVTADGEEPITVTDQDGDGVTFTPTNDEPIVGPSTITVGEGERVVITEAELSTIDEVGETAPEDLRYTILLESADPDQLDGFEVDGVLQTTPGIPVIFTQAQINNGQVAFVAGGANSAPTIISATVTDTAVVEAGEVNVVDVPLVIALNADNDPLQVVNNLLEISEGETLTLDADNLLTQDEETPPAELVYTIDEVLNGSFQRIDVDLGTVIGPIAVGETFTQADVSGGAIQFVHDGEEEAPSYTLTVVDTPLVVDGPTNSETIVAFIPEGGFTNVNDAPTLDLNTLTIDEGQVDFTFTAENLAASDPDSTLSQLSFEISGVEGGTFFLNGEELVEGITFTSDVIAFGELTFTDDGDEVAPSYSVTVRDPEGGSSEATPAIVVLNQINDDPEIETNTFTFTEGQRLVLNDPATGIINLQATDDETPDDELVYVISDGVVGGEFFDFNAQPINTFTQAELNDGNISFLPDGGEEKPAFEITVSDQDGGVETVQANVEDLIPVNDPPTLGENPQVTITEGEPLTLTLENLSATDPDTPDEDLIFNITDLAGGEFISLAPDAVNPVMSFTQGEVEAGQIQFVDDGDETPPAFSVSVSDGELTTEAVPVTITDFINVNDPPVAVDDAGDGFSTPADTILTTASVIANDTDEDGDALTVTQVAGQAVTAGAVTLESGALVTALADGTLSYDPNGQFGGLAQGATVEDSFTYVVSDGNGGTATANVTVEIVGVNDLPDAVDDGGEGSEGFVTDDNQDLTTPVLTLNDTDPDNDTLTVTAINGTAVAPNGSVELDTKAIVTLNDDNSVTYTPSPTYQLLAVGQTVDEIFEYTVSDGKGGEDTATVTILVNGANEAPVATDDLDPGFATTEGTEITLDVLANDTDIDTIDELTIESVDTTGITGEVINNGGDLTYIPALVLKGGETAEEIFSYTVSDGNGGTDTADVKVTVTGVNDAPIAVNDSGGGFITNEVTAFVTANVLANDSDPEGGPITLTGFDASGTQGVVTSNGDGTFNYDPNGAFNTLPQSRTATDSFSYTIQDDEGLTTTATVSIQINGLQSEFFDFERFLQEQNPAAVAPADTIGGLPLAQLYDESFYLSENPDVAAAVASGDLSSGYEHFITSGISEGRSPSVLYDEAFYLSSNPDVAAAVNAGDLNSGLEHFLNTGHIEGRDPSALFDQSDYLAANPDVANAVTDGSFDSGFDHYVSIGAEESRSPDLSLYNESFYLSNNLDVVAAVSAGDISSGYDHFISAGQIEGRAPSALYNEASYLSLNPDVAAAIDAGDLVSGFQHYESAGRFEGRFVF